MKKENVKALKWLHKQSKSVYLPLIFLTVLGMIIAWVSVEFALYSKDVLDSAQNLNSDNSLKIKIIALMALVVFQVAIQALYSFLNVKISSKYSIRVKRSIFNTILRKDYAHITAYHTGELLNRINNDVNIIVSGVMNILPNVISLITRILLSFGTLFILDRQFATICLIIGPVILILTRMYSKKMKSLHKKCMETDGKTRSFMLECMQNLLVIKTYKNIDAVTEKSSEYQDSNYKFTIKRSYISIIMNVIFFLGVSAAYYAALAYCAYKVSIGVMTFGTLLAIIQLVGQVQVPFKELASAIPQYFSALASAERLLEIEELPEDNGQTVIRKNDANILAEFKNVDFSYDEKAIFENANFVMKKGEFIAISGLSGIGKSTFLKLILGIIHPQNGEICIYSDNPQKLTMAYVPQGNLILSGSIKENIAFYLPIDDEKIIEAAKASDIYDFVSALPRSFDTVLGEKGLGLSEGQIQRIAIARAVYCGAELLILDECTSALDEETEKNVLSNLKKLENKSCIIVSHKKAAIEMCEKTLKIENCKPTVIEKE